MTGALGERVHDTKPEITISFGPCLPIAAMGLLLSGCVGRQSALAPAGHDAEQISNLFWVMTAGASIIWALVLGTALAATLGLFKNPTRLTPTILIVGGGVVFPTVILGILLIFGLRLLPNWQSEPDRLQIHVHGEQWWWRVAYRTPDQIEPVISANEIHLPAGQAVEFVLTSADVIHSFWIPSIGGKLDMIPGRTTRLLLEATRPGVYRGVCAEYCGTSHAKMAFAVVVHEPKDFNAWLEDRTSDPNIGTDDPGRKIFLSSGCAACHRIRGLTEIGSVGPDLSHIGSRRTIGAGIAENTPKNLARWITDPAHMKPVVQMPAYRALPPEDIAAIARFLSNLN